MMPSRGMGSMNPKKIKKLASGGSVTPKKPKKLASGGKTKQQGLAPSGVRHSGEGVKGKGYFGKLPMSDGRTMTEYSIGESIDKKIVEMPSVVPGLTKKELKHLTDGGKVTPTIRNKAIKHAKQRIKEGKSPFAGATELRMPKPKDGYSFAKGGQTKSKVNEAGNYTKPGLRKRIFNSIKAGGKGGAPGQWSARKAQMMAKRYKEAGGGYKS